MKNTKQTQKAAVLIGRIFALIALMLTALLIFFVGWNSWDLVRTGFPLQNIVSGEFPLEYSVGQGSSFNAIQIAIMFGFPFVIFLCFVSFHFFRSREVHESKSRI